MEDNTSSDTKYTSDNGNKLQKPHIVALNIEGLGEDMVCDFDREDGQAIHTCGNAKSEALKDLLEEFLEQFKDPKDIKVETSKACDETNDEDLEDSEFDKRKETPQTTTRDARFYNNNIEHGVVDD